MTRAEKQCVRELTDQIARDNWTLDHQPDPAPDAKFYIHRINEYRNSVLRLQHGKTDD